MCSISQPMAFPTRSKTRRGLKSKPKKGEERSVVFLMVLLDPIWIPLGGRCGVHPARCLPQLWGSRRHSFLPRRSEIKDEITQVKTSTPAKVSRRLGRASDFGSSLSPFGLSQKEGEALSAPQSCPRAEPDPKTLRKWESQRGWTLGEGGAHGASRVLQTTPPKCVDCRQYLDDPDLKFFQGDADDAVMGPSFGRCRRGRLQGLMVGLGP